MDKNLAKECDFYPVSIKKEYEDDFADELFENFVLKSKEKLVGIKEILEENDGKMFNI